MHSIYFPHTISQHRKICTSNQNKIVVRRINHRGKPLASHPTKIFIHEDNGFRMSFNNIFPVKIRQSITAAITIQYNSTVLLLIHFLHKIIQGSLPGSTITTYDRNITRQHKIIPDGIIPNLYSMSTYHTITSQKAQNCDTILGNYGK